MHCYFSASEQRVVQPNHTISWYGKILPDETHFLIANKHVDVRTSPEGEPKISEKKRHKGWCLFMRVNYTVAFTTMNER